MKKTTFIVLSAFILFSCNKSDKDEPKPCTISTTAIAGPYKITAMTYKASASSAEEDYFNIILDDPCRRDDIYTFNINNTYQLKDAGTVCSPLGDENGTWALLGNTMTKDGDALTIESFDCKTLVLINTDTQTAGDKFKITMTKQ